MLVILIHGKDSNSQNSRTVQTIKNYLESIDSNLYQVFPIDYDSNKSHKEISEHMLRMTALYKSLTNETEICFIGCSLGGYWCNFLADKYKGSKLIMINPSLKYYGEDKMIECKNNEITIFLAKDDDVVSWEIAYRHYLGKVDIRLFQDGGHRFSHLESQLPVIIKAINNIVE